MVRETLVRVSAPDFVAGAVFAMEPLICIHAADKLAHFIGRGIHKLEDSARRNKWKIEYL